MEHLVRVSTAILPVNEPFEVGIQKEVAVVGGGLAGMAAALRLCERDFDVTIYESTNRLGGKSGADRHDADAYDHGYHIFPGWYANLWQLIREVGLEERFTRRDQMVQLEAGAYPDFRPFNLMSLAKVPMNLRARIMPWTDLLLFYYALLDLASQPYRRRAFLDQISVNGFLRSRLYRTEGVALQLQQLVLKGISVPVYNVSAMTMRAVVMYYLKSPSPLYSLLKGDLQSGLIEPLSDRLRALGCAIETGRTLTGLEVEDGRVGGLRFGDEVVTAANVVLAIPAERIRALVDDSVYDQAPGMSRIARLRTVPMSAVDLYLTHKIAELPSDLMVFKDSRFGLSALDVSNVWPGLEQTVLSVTLADSASVRGLSTSRAVEAVVDEIERYVPGVRRDRVDWARSRFQAHIDTPLLVNSVGSWRDRLSVDTSIANLYVAGDHCRSHIDLTSMEGAVSTGLAAAESLRVAVEGGSPTSQPIEVLRPPVPKRWVLVMLRTAGWPFAILLKAVHTVMRVFSPAGEA